jgi:hypothetical protein
MSCESYTELTVIISFFFFFFPCFICGVGAGPKVAQTLKSTHNISVRNATGEKNHTALVHVEKVSFTVLSLFIMKFVEIHNIMLQV